MAIKETGSLGLGADIAAELGGSQPHSLSEYYGAANGIPTSGPIKFSDFYGASANLAGLFGSGDLGFYYDATASRYWADTGQSSLVSNQTTEIKLIEDLSGNGQHLTTSGIYRIPYNTQQAGASYHYPASTANGSFYMLSPMQTGFYGKTITVAFAFRSKPGLDNHYTPPLNANNNAGTAFWADYKGVVQIRKDFYRRVNTYIGSYSAYGTTDYHHTISGFESYYDDDDDQGTYVLDNNLTHNKFSEGNEAFLIIYEIPATPGGMNAWLSKGNGSLYQEWVNGLTSGWMYNDMSSSYKEMRASHAIKKNLADDFYMVIGRQLTSQERTDIWNYWRNTFVLT